MLLLADTMETSPSLSPEHQRSISGASGTDSRVPARSTVNRITSICLTVSVAAMIVWHLATSNSTQTNLGEALRTLANLTVRKP